MRARGVWSRGVVGDRPKQELRALVSSGGDRVTGRARGPPEKVASVGGFFVGFFVLKRRWDDGFLCSFLFALFPPSIDPPFFNFSPCLFCRDDRAGKQVASGVVLLLQGCGGWVQVLGRVHSGF